MTNRLTLAVVAIAMLGLTAAVAMTTIAVRPVLASLQAGPPEIEPMLDKPIVTINDTEITAPAAATEIHAISSSILGFDSVFIGNSSTNCIRVGGATLTTTSGFDVGSGCRDGTGVSLDAKYVWIMDDGGGTVAGVDVVWGAR